MFYVESSLIFNIKHVDALKTAHIAYLSFDDSEIFF